MRAPLGPRKAAPDAIKAMSSLHGVPLAKVSGGSILSVRRECPFYTEVNRIGHAIGGASRTNVAFRTVPGSYQPAVHHAAE